MLKNWKKNGKKYQKYAEIRDVKILQDYQADKTCHSLYPNKSPNRPTARQN